MKEIVKISNNDLKNLITETIKKVIKEDGFNGISDYTQSDDKQIQAYIYEINDLLKSITQPYGDKQNQKIVSNIFYDAQKLKEIVDNYWMNEQ